MMPSVAAFIPHSMIEWEDRLAAVLILQGCNFRCPFCHSAKYVPPGDPESPIPWGDLALRLGRERDWIDGVVVSGGEPTIHAGVGELLSALRDLGLAVKLDTNGSAPERLRELVEAGLVQHVALDVKAPLDDAGYAAATGRPGALASVLRSLEFLRGGAVSFELRTTLYPPVFGDARLRSLAGQVAWAPRWFLQAFRPESCLDPAACTQPATDLKWLARMVAECRAIAPACRARGGLE